jgi:hypothetical protein
MHVSLSKEEAMSTTIDAPELIERPTPAEGRSRGAARDEQSLPGRDSASAILVLVWLTFLKFAALMFLVAVIVAPLFPGLVVLGLACAMLAPPYLVLRRLRGGA